MEKEPSGVESESPSGKKEMDSLTAWEISTQALSTAGKRMDEATEDLFPEERADGFRALVHAVNNQLAGLEVDKINLDLRN